MAEWDGVHLANCADYDKCCCATSGFDLTQSPTMKAMATLGKTSNGSDYRPHYAEFAHQVEAVSREISAMLIDKNRKYGNSALNPIRLFSKADALEQINVRLDDKLSRLQQSRPGEDEDVELDLIGYLFIRRIARKAQQP